MPKIEIVPAFIGVAIAAKGLQHIVGHVCRDLVGVDLGITILFLHYAPDHPFPTEAGIEQGSSSVESNLS